MRTSSLVTVSLPHAMVKASERVAKRHHMTRSELVRTALRHFLDEQATLEAIRIYAQERRTGRLKELKSLATLAR